MDSQPFVSKFLVQLPEKKVLEEFIRKELGDSPSKLQENLISNKL
jgi:hypothetical protein